MERTIFYDDAYRTISIEYLEEDCYDSLDTIKSLTCVHCGEVLTFDEDDDVETEVWCHLSFDHPDVHDEWQNYNTPEMLEECYR